MEKKNLEEWEKFLKEQSIASERTIEDGCGLLKATLDIYVPDYEKVGLLTKKVVHLEIKSDEEGSLSADLIGGTVHMHKGDPGFVVTYFLCEKKLHSLLPMRAKKSFYHLLVKVLQKCWYKLSTAVVFVRRPKSGISLSPKNYQIPISDNTVQPAK